jgi:hypothetical protein
LAKAITRIGDDHVVDEMYAAAAAHLSEPHIAAVSWLTIRHETRSTA